MGNVIYAHPEWVRHLGESIGNDMQRRNDDLMMRALYGERT